MSLQSRAQPTADRSLRLSAGPAIYQIRVQSCLDDHWASWFERMELTWDDDEKTTTLTGTLADQAALHGILARIRDLGLPLVSLERLGPPR